MLNFLFVSLIGFLFLFVPASSSAATSPPNTLKVVIEDESGSPVTDANVHYGGFSPATQSGNQYYFNVSGMHGLVIERSGYTTDDGGKNTALKAVTSGSESAQTVIELTSSLPCESEGVLAGSRVQCLKLAPSVSFSVKDETGNIIVGASVKVYKDIGRQELATDLSISGGSGAKETDNSGKAKFALTGGIYYYKIERLGKNDVNGSFTLSAGGSKDVSAILTIAGTNVVSPSRTTALLDAQSAVADGATKVNVIITLKDGNANTMSQNIAVKLFSSRPSYDTITPSEVLTDTGGRAAFNVVSAKGGKSILFVTVGKTLLSIFPEITFIVPASVLESKTVSAADSSVESSASPVVALGSESVTVKVTARNAGEVALEGKTVKLTSSRGSLDSITPPTAVTKSDGTAIFAVTSKTAGTAILKVEADGVLLSEVAATFSAPVESQALEAGALIKLPDDGDPTTAEDAAVYYYAADGKRYVFPDVKTYFTWYVDFSSVREVSSSVLANIPIGGNVTARPGARLLKIQTDPKVYAVGKGGALRWLASETVAKEIFGADWAKLVNDLPDTSFADYKSGADITDARQYNQTAEKANAPDINADKSLGA